MTNKLFYGDNLDIMRKYISDESIDLIYLDPPFNSKATYNVLFKEKSGEKSSAQIQAFDDTWHWDQKAEETYHEIISKSQKAEVIEVLRSLRSFLGSNDMMAYLTMIAIRLIELHRVLKKDGFIFLHCDQVANHYLKILVDAVFGPNNFRNDIIWSYRSWGRKLKYNLGYEYQNILFYSKQQDSQLNEYPTKPWESKEEYIKVRKQKVRKDETGREYLLSDAGGGERVKRYIDEAMKYGRPVGEVWDDIPYLTSSAKERLGYPTQKPERLLERIIKMGSKEGDVILDPFCGCGTTISVAEALNRKWIGIDITHLAVSLMKNRLTNTFGEELSNYEVHGDPKNIEGAKELAEMDRFEFERWAVGLVNGMPFKGKGGSDKGKDGIIYFFDDQTPDSKKIVIQVKSGKVGSKDIRELKGTMENEDAEIALFITLKEPTKPMKTEAAKSGYYIPDYFPNKKYPRIQILTIKELLEGKEPKYPKMNIGTFKKAERRKKDTQNGQSNLNFEE